MKRRPECLCCSQRSVVAQDTKRLVARMRHRTVAWAFFVLRDTIADVLDLHVCDKRDLVDLVDTSADVTVEVVRNHHLTAPDSAIENGA